MIINLKKALIVAFCLWHVTALTAYSITDGMAKLPLFGTIREAAYQKTRPYMLSTSLWQRWPLFAPDPLRRVISYTIEGWNYDHWEVVDSLGPDEKGKFHGSSMLKLIRRIDQNEHQGPLRERFVHRTCTTKNLLPGTQLRLTRSYHVIPRNKTPQSISWWQNWQPDWRTNEVLTTRCPDILVL